MTQYTSDELLVAIAEAGLESPAAAAEGSCEELRMCLGENVGTEQALELHAALQKARDDALIQEKRALIRASPLLPVAIQQEVEQAQQAAPPEPGADPGRAGKLPWFAGRDSRYSGPGDVASMFSPTAYLADLYRHAKALYPGASPWNIDRRRPDLKALALSQTNLDAPLSVLSLSNEILLKKVRPALDPQTSLELADDKVLEDLSNHVGSSGTPYHHQHNRLRQALARKDPDFTHMLAAPQVLKHMSQASLASLYYPLSPALRDLLTDSITEQNADAKFSRYFAGTTPEAMMQPARMRSWFDLSDTELQGFMGSLDEPEYMGNTLTARQDNEVVRLTISGGSQYINYVRLFPVEAGKWQLAFSLKVSRVANFRLLGGTFLAVAASEFGVEELLPNTEYRRTFDWLGMPASFNLITEWTQSVAAGSGTHRYSYNVTHRRYSAASYLLRLNKIVRLYKATGLSARVLEDIVSSVNALHITNATLEVLLRTAQMIKRYGISHEEALLLSSGVISHSARAGEKSQFDRLFNDPALVVGGLSLANERLLLHPDRSDEHADIKATLKRACQTDDEGLHELGRIYTGSTAQDMGIQTTLIDFSRIYTLSLWSRVHGLTPKQLSQLLQTIGAPAALREVAVGGWLQWLARLSATVDGLQARGWTAYDLLLMTRDVGAIPASTEIANLLNDLKRSSAGMQRFDLVTTLRALSPQVASAFSLGGEACAQALLIWAHRARPGNLSLLEAGSLIRQTSLNQEQSQALTAFAYGLAQMALIVHACGVQVDTLALLVQQPQKLCLKAVQGTGSGATLRRDVSTLMALGEFTDWLKRLPDHGGASGALLSALKAPSGVSQALLSMASGMQPAALGQAILQAHARGDVQNAARLSSWSEIDAVRQWAALANAFAVMPQSLGRMIALDEQRAATSGDAWANWRTVADAFQAGLSPTQMKQAQSATELPLSQAIVGLLGARDKLTVEQLNQHLLLDALNGPQVVTTRIAEATAALQTFIHRALTDPEDRRALSRAAVDRQFFRDWTRWNSRYASWAAGQMLMYYPENFIDPTVRLGQTKAMDDMLQALGQAQINADTVGDAFHGYLSSFEEVANLETISGYHDSRDLDSGKSWFIGRSRGEPRDYWWRTVDEGKRGRDGLLPANAWTSWTKIDLVPQVSGRLIRPVVYRERLYLGWVERQQHVTSRTDSGEPKSHEWRWSFKLSWLRYDGNWSAPLDYPLSIGDLPEAVQGRLSLFLACWPERNGLLVSLYDRNTSNASAITTYAGMEIFENLSHKPLNIAVHLKHVEHWLDTPRHTGMCAVFEGLGMPVAQRTLTAKGGIPKGFTQFNATLRRAGVANVSGTQHKTYSLNLDMLLTVSARQAQVPNRWMTALVNKYPELAQAGVVNMLARSSHGALAVHDGWAYLCVSVARLAGYFRRGEHLHFEQVFDSGIKANAPFLREATAAGAAHVGKFKLGAPGYPLVHMAFSFARRNGQADVAARGVPITELLMYPGGMRQERADPQDYLHTPGQVPASRVRCFIYRADGVLPMNISATRPYDLSALTQQVPFNLVTAVGNTAHWGGRNYAIHRIQFEFGLGNTRDFEIRVYKDADTLKTAIIGTTGKGAQYLAKGGWITRLNTLFAHQLTERAVSGIGTILSYDTQQMVEPEVGVTARLTLPVYNRSYHGSDPSAEIYLANSSRQRTLLWSGELDRVSKDVNVTFSPHALYEGTPTYHLETRYQAIHNTAASAQSIVIDSNTMRITRSSEHGSRLLKDNIQRVVVLDANSTTLMDFTGANALYFWELFYYTPMMVMQRFLQEERFDLAETWLKYVFNPAGYTVGGQYTSRMWGVRPLQEDTSWNDEPLKALDPDAVAQNDPMHYKLNAFMRLLDISIGRGDAAFRKLERDSLTEAKVWYRRALALLGDAPWVPRANGWSAPSLGQVADNPSRVRFLPEVNRVMLGYWETLRIRLYNLRHNLTLDGQPLVLPLYAAADDPSALLGAAVSAEVGGEQSLSRVSEVPALRFTPLLEGARSMAGQLIQFGNTLQGILERQDAEALAELLNTQGAELADSNLGLYEQTLKELSAERVTLEKALDGAALRRDHYRNLFEENINSRELKALDLTSKSQSAALGGMALNIAGALVGLAPNVFGLANGGMKYDGPLYAAAQVANIQAQVHANAAARIGQEEGYRRRQQEWEIQHKSAQQEIAQVQAQLDALSVRETSARMQVAHLQAQSAQAQAQLAMLQGKLTGKKMYSWLRARLASIFYTYYDLTASRCMMAQRALQWEQADTTSYLSTGTWNGAWAGLLCGEGLMLALAQMETAWVKWQKRELEVTRTLSLAKLLDGKLASGGTTVTLNGAFKALIDGQAVQVDAQLALCHLTLVNDTLSVQFGLKELGLAAGFESAALRRVRSIAVSLPAVLGPYQDVHARLSTSATGLPAGCNESVISHAMHDNGLFAQNAVDSLQGQGAHLLPFEGLHIALANDRRNSTALVLNFAAAKSAQKALLQSLSDIILHVQFTVR
ncbi:Tc toxin subunit A-related protein [Pseudomonas putida]